MRGKLRSLLLASIGTICVACIAAGVAARPAAAQAINFDLVFNAQPGGACDPGVIVCGTVLVPRFGRATATFTPTGFAPGPGDNCFTGEGIVGISLESDGSTLRLATHQIACTPGASAGSPGNQGPSQGEPFQGDGTWAVLDGSGIFAGATGSGSASSINGGHIAVARYTGTITLP